MSNFNICKIKDFLNMLRKGMIYYQRQTFHIFLLFIAEVYRVSFNFQNLYEHPT